MELCVLAKKRSSKSTTTKINVICKRARVSKINQQKYPKTLKEYENKLLKPLPAVSVRSFTLGWSVYVLGKVVRQSESIQEMKVLYVYTLYTLLHIIWVCYIFLPPSLRMHPCIISICVCVFASGKLFWTWVKPKYNSFLSNDATNQDEHFKQIENKKRWDNRQMDKENNHWIAHYHRCCHHHHHHRHTTDDNGKWFCCTHF